jgi:hypothetical protein
MAFKDERCQRKLGIKDNIRNPMKGMWNQNGLERIG